MSEREFIVDRTSRWSCGEEGNLRSFLFFADDVVVLVSLCHDL